MKDTTFWPSPAQKRIASSYRPDSKANCNQWKCTFSRAASTANLTLPRRRPVLHGGVWVAFYQMILNGGTYKGKQFEENP